jgi:uncharacterized protein (DUF488 family)
MHNSFLYTIGHGTRKAEDFLTLLKTYEIDFLADVRSIPRSRFNPQYNQKTLQKFLAEHNITYVFLGDALGGRPQDPDCYDSLGKIDYAIVKKKLFFRQGIERLKIAHQKKIPLALMCSESKPHECHRSRLIAVALNEEQVSVMHIDEKGLLKDQAEVMRLVRAEGSGNLF